MNRREMMQRTALGTLALGVSQIAGFPLGWAPAADAPKRRVLLFTRSQGFQHPVVTRGKNDAPSLVEQTVTDLGAKHDFEVVATKDGRVFVNEKLDKFDAFIFETTGDLTKEGGDMQPPMPPEGKELLLKAIAGGKGFVGSHCASDTFHSVGERAKGQLPEKIDPYIAMLGGEFIIHGIQQKAWMRVIDPAFPGAKDMKDFEMMEEWYSLKNFAPDLHVILVQETKGMTGPVYERPNFPATWARKHDKGRVFYTSMGHREDVWQSDTFQGLLLGGLSWAFGNVEADVTPNLEKAAPKASELAPPPPPKKK